MKPQISIIVPVYKSEAFIEEMLQSLLHQTLYELEIILVDDGSPDRSGYICDEYAAKDNRIIVIHQENGGAGSARNAGLEKATGEYIGFCDSDDWVDLEMYNKMYQQASINDVDAVRCNTLSHETWGNRITWCPECTNVVLNGDFIKSRIIPMMIAPEKEGDFNKRLLKGCVCFIFKRELLNKQNIRFKNFKSGEDFIFITEALWNAKSLILMSEPFYHYRRQASGSLSVSMERFRNYKQRFESRSIMKNIVKDTPYYPIFKERWEQADRRYVYLDCRIATVYNPSGKMKDKMKLLREVLESEECKIAFSRPIEGELPFQMRVLYYLISKNHPWLLYLAINLKFKK